jgi:hypothetical protein
MKRAYALGEERVLKKKILLFKMFSSGFRISHPVFRTEFVVSENT